MNMRSLFCLWVTGPVSAYQWAGVLQAADREFRMIPGLCTLYEVFS